MKCPQCDNEMPLDYLEQEESVQVFHFRCVNPQCTRYQPKPTRGGVQPDEKAEA